MPKLSALNTESTFASSDYLVKVKSAGGGDVLVLLSDFVSAAGAAWDGWAADTKTWTYVSATSFKISGQNVTSQFPVGTKIKLTQTTDKYFYVTSSTFSTDTTVNITGGSDYSLANAAITSPMYSYMDTPQGFPTEFNYTPTFVNWTIGTGGNAGTQGKFRMVGAEVSGRIVSVLGSSGASVGTIVTATAPTAIKPVSTLTVGTLSFQIGTAFFENTGIANYQGEVSVSAAGTPSSFGISATKVDSTYRTLAPLSSTAPFTWGAGDGMAVTFKYMAP